MSDDPRTAYLNYIRHAKGRRMTYGEWTQVRYARELLLKDVQERDSYEKTPTRCNL